MRTQRTIWAWLTLLLFLGGIASPRLLAAVRSTCPMQQVEQEKHCSTAPAPIKPACCQKHEAELANTGSITGRCCCDMKATTERTETPATLTSVPELTTLPLMAIAVPLSPTIGVDTILPVAVNETAPRGPPIRSCSPRAPPLS